MTLAAAPAEPELMVGHAPKLGKKHHHEQNEGYGSFFCTTWIKDGKSFRMINFAIMRGHLIIILTCVFTVYDCAKFTQLKNLLLYLALLGLSLWSNSPATEQDLNRTLMDDTSIKWSISKTLLFFIRF